MSILIKGMEMPKRCEDCVMYRNNVEYDYAYCCISSVNVLGHGNARLNGCPLIEVPPHGRLIDADAIPNPYEGSSLVWEWALIKKLIDDKLPTIIEVEEETHYGDICDNCVDKDSCDMAKSCDHNPPITACYAYKAEEGEKNEIDRR